MDFFGIPRGSIRSQALNRIAALSVSEEPEQPSTNGYPNGFTNGTTNGTKKSHHGGLSGDALKIAKIVTRQDISKVAISHKELEIIFALASSAEFVKTEQQAEDLFGVLSTYFIEASTQHFKSHASLQLGPSPWDYLTRQLTTAIITLSIKFPSLIPEIKALFHKYLNQFRSTEDLKLTRYFSLLGFLKSLIDVRSPFDDALVEQVVSLFNPEFLDSLESVTMRALEEELELTYLLAYKATADEFNSLLFAKLVQQFFTRVIVTIISKEFGEIIPETEHQSLLDYILVVYSIDYDQDPKEPSIVKKLQNVLSKNVTLVRTLCHRASAQIDELDNGSTYINLSSTERADLAMRTKSLALQVLSAGMIIDVASSDLLIQSVKSALCHPTEAVDAHLCPVIISVGSLLTFTGNKGVSGDLIHSFPLLISNISADSSPEFVKHVARSLAYGLKPLNDDPTVSTIYSLVNMLVSENLSAPVTALRELKLRSATTTFNSKARASRSNTFTRTNGSDHSLPVQDGNEHSHIFKNAITAAMEIARVYGSSDITKLAVSILSQKFRTVSREVDLDILDGLSEIAPFLDETNFLTLLKLYDNAMTHANGDETLVRAITHGRVKISKSLEGKVDHPLFYLNLNELLKSVVNLGAVQNKEHRSQGVISEIAVQISLLLPPIAQLLPKKQKLKDLDEVIVNSFKNFWFNIVVHGYSETSNLTKKYYKELQIIALNSPPLACASPIARAETSFELNTVLRRGSSNHNVKDQKHIISGVSNTNSLELKALSYSKLMFLSATSLLENLRVSVGGCSTILQYFGDPAIAKANIEKFVGSIAISVTQTYTKLATTGHSTYFTSDGISDQFINILILCVDRNYDLQDAAFQCATLFMNKLPSTLSTHKALFTLLDLLTAMQWTYSDAFRRKYQPNRVFILPYIQRKITVSDSVKWKESTLSKLETHATEWCKTALVKCDHDIKVLLLSYAESAPYGGKTQYGVDFASKLTGSMVLSDIEKSFSLPGQIHSALTNQSTKMGLMTMGECIHGENPENATLIAALNDYRRGMGSKSVSSDADELYFLSLNGLTYNTFAEILIEWQKKVKSNIGLFSKQHDLVSEGFLRMVYVPSDKPKVDYYADLVAKSFEADTSVIMLLLHHFHGTLYQSEHMLQLFTGIAFDVLEHFQTASLHPFSRALRFQFIRFAIDLLQTHMKLRSGLCSALVVQIFDGILSWFVQNRPYPFGDDLMEIDEERAILTDVFEGLRHLSLPAPGYKFFEETRQIALAFLSDEINKIMIWLKPLDPVEFKGQSFKIDSKLLHFAYTIDSSLAFSLVQRDPSLEKYMRNIVAESPFNALSHPDSVKYLRKEGDLLKYIILATPVSPTESINLFRPPYIMNPYVLQYNMRALEAQDINLTFFYVPQIVQGLTHDDYGYVSRFIVEVSQVSQKFSHQLIWNLLANTENPELGAERMIQKIVDSYDEDSMDYYKKEFGFFDEVTGISGKLRPYLKNTKAEKKVKIDEEMAKIEILENVYLPSNPDGVVIDINRTSGKPLQSHAKTPFMATFKIRKDELHNGELVTVDKWQSAIFKVGDDVRQDVLALQLIAVFKSVWENAGLDLYCFPNRVTATAPGCGVIDVLPNSISRDMLGREAVNDLYTYFRAKFPDGELELEDAVQNFVKSLAAYSIISYLLQFKDRHNGNIMYDDKGHILHIDFGFCFDIVPGGVKFEACPFKLTKEMVRVMGGSNKTESFQMFEELFIKGFLAMRPHADLVIGNVQTMLGSGLPCFKEKTIKNLRGRFFLEKNDKECIKALKGLIRQSYESMFSVGYDKFQKMTNGIPY